jgi:hypothetical protein
LLEHDLFRKPVSTFRDHALTQMPNNCLNVRAAVAIDSALARERALGHAVARMDHEHGRAFAGDLVVVDHVGFELVSPWLYSTQSRFISARAEPAATVKAAARIAGSILNVDMENLPEG